MNIAKLAATVRRVAEEQPMYRLETRTELFAAADLLTELIGPDPKAASLLAAEASALSTSEASETATAGPGPTYCNHCGYEFPNHHFACLNNDYKAKTVKMACSAEENERVSMADATPIQVVLHMDD